MTEFITRNYGQKEFEVIIKTDSKEHYKAVEDFARDLIDHSKPQTNADRIRAMSDEELAEFIRDVSYECRDASWGCHCQTCSYPWCSSDQTAEWLKQPAEE